MKKVLWLLPLLFVTSAYGQDASTSTSTAPTAALQAVDEARGYMPNSWDWKINSHFSIGISSDVGDFYTVGCFDYVNNQFLAGWGKELFPVKYNNREVAYFAAQNVFNANEGGKGAIGGAFGVRPVNLINSVAQAVGTVGSLVTLPPLLNTISNYSSFEVGYAYRLQNIPGLSRHEGTVGGQVRVPFDLLTHK